ncbi:DUF6807 family protein [Kineococcus sp. SYSU DK002]|uniref:DUF6807 family protein n=1 Tax=Kineococcus sp. SYSU DK002 TaxID=3383123 RepID=UPI003D7DBDBE
MIAGTLEVEGRTVAVLDDGTGMERRLSPRPHLHPVRTLGGRLVTDVRPDDHLHHHGVGIAVPDVDGTSYWGGRTYVRGEGSRELGNHGVQRLAAPGGTVDWTDRHGRLQIREQRRTTATPDPEGWLLRWRSTVEALAPLSVGSPATNGRDGAFYGGWLWRTPFATAQVHVAEGEGTATAHGSTSPWLSLSAEGVWLLAVQRAEPLPWFVRTEGWVGFGPAWAVDRRRELRPGEPLHVHLDVLVGDGHRSGPQHRDTAARLLGQDTP